MTPWDDRQWAKLDQALEKLEVAWKTSPEPELAQFLPCLPDDPEYPIILARLIAVDRECRRKAGRPKSSHEYIAEWPILHDNPDLLSEKETDAFITDPTSEKLGSTIGPYKLLSILGEGGFGVVYLAEQEKPVRRRVALKIIKAGMDTAQVLARFDAERQALAMMDHSNIARVYDVGMTETGRSYFAMELVHGESLTAYCDRHRLSLEERLLLFIPVSHAVQHAHQKGIIHRDLKPSNVLITVVDDQPVPKIIDFGVAKAIAQPLTERTIFTEQGQLIGTPEYMSPEQAEMTSLDIDTRSDIYSLGVMLYELLTGLLPFDRHTLRHAGFDEIRRMIREVESPKPSAKASATDDSSCQRAKNRRTDPQSLSRLLRQELDWIVMKTLEKDRTRRYPTALGLADDIQRYLKKEPVQAGPPGGWYQVRKFVGKHRLTIGISTMILLLLFVGVTASTYFAIIAKRNAANAEAATKIAEKEKARAVEQFLRTRQAQYVLLVNLAQREIQDGDFIRAEQLLDATPEDLRGWEYYYLWTTVKKRLIRFIGHNAWVTSAAFSPDGKQIVSGSGDNTLKIWDAATGVELYTLKGHKFWVTSVAYSPNGKLVVSGNGDNLIKIWNTETGAEIRTLKGHASAVLCVAFNIDGMRVVSGSDDGAVKIWDTATGDEIRTIDGHAEAVRCVAYSPDGRRIVSGGGDNNLKIWDATTGAEIKTLEGHAEAVNCLAISQDGKLIASASDDRTIKLWDSATGKETRTLKGHNESVHSVAFSPDGTHLITGSSDRTLKIWDVTSGEEIISIKEYTNAITCAAFSPDGKRILSGGKDNMLKIRDITPGSEIRTFQGHGEAVQCVAFSPDGKLIVSGSGDNTLKIWDVMTGAEFLTLNGHDNVITSAAFSPDGTRIISASRDNTARIWDAATGREIRILQGHQYGVNSVAFSPDGKSVISGGGDKKLKIWNAMTGEEVRTLNGHGNAVTCVAFSPDGLRIVSGDRDSKIKIWDITAGAEIFTLIGHNDPVYNVAFSPDGTRIVSGSGDRTLKIWDASHGAEILTLHGHYDPVFSVAFSPDGKRIVSGSGDKTLKIWDAATGAEILTLKGNASWVNSVAFSLDGARIASGGMDSTLRIWDAEPPQAP